MTSPAQTTSPFPRYLQLTQNQRLHLSGGSWLSSVWVLTWNICSQLHSGSSEAEEENDPDGVYAFRRKAGCQYYAVSHPVAGHPSCVITTNSIGCCRHQLAVQPVFAVCNTIVLPPASPGLRGELALVWTRGGRSCRSAISLQSHHAHCATALPWYGSAACGTRGQVRQRLIFKLLSLIFLIMSIVSCFEVF